MPINNYMTITITFFEAGYWNYMTITITIFIHQELQLIRLRRGRYACGFLQHGLDHHREDTLRKQVIYDCRRACGTCLEPLTSP